MAVVRHKEAIHSGHFMVSNFEAEAEDDEEDIAVPVPDEADIATTVPDVAVQERVQNQFNSLVSLLNDSVVPNADNLIDASLTKLFQCMSIAYRQRLTSPKWNRFLGMKLRWKDKIRLNNVIWRCWHMQFIKGHRKLVCAFANPLEIDNHNKTEAGALMEGKYWKRKRDTILAEYRKWRTFYHNENCSHTHTDCTFGGDLNTTLGLGERTGKDDIELESMITDADFFVDALFNSLGSSNCPGNADFIQGGLGSLQPNLDDLMDLDPMAPLQDWLSSKLPDSVDHSSSHPVRGKSQTPGDLVQGGSGHSNGLAANVYPIQDIKDIEVMHASYHPFSHASLRDVAGYKRQQQTQLQPHPQRQQPPLQQRQLQLHQSQQRQQLQVHHQQQAQNSLMVVKPEPQQQKKVQLGGKKPWDQVEQWGGSGAEQKPCWPGKRWREMVAREESEAKQEADMALQRPVVRQRSVIQDPVSAYQTEADKPRSVIAANPGMAYRSSNIVTSHGVTPNSVTPNSVTPNILAPNIVNSNIVSPNIMAPNIVTPNKVSPNIASPNIVTPNLASPIIASPNIASPNIRTPNLAPPPQNKSVLPLLHPPDQGGGKVRSQGVAHGGAHQGGTFSVANQGGTHVVPHQGGNHVVPHEGHVVPHQVGTPSILERKVTPGREQLVQLLQVRGGPSPTPGRGGLGGPSPTPGRGGQRRPVQQKPMKTVGQLNSVRPPGGMRLEEVAEDLSSRTFLVQHQAHHQRASLAIPPPPPGSLPQPSFTLGGSSLASLVTEDTKLSSAEQKRRGTIKNGFEFLRALVPSLSQNPSVKVSKAALLTKGAEYVLQLKEEKLTLQKEVEALRQSVDSLNQEIIGYQAQLPTAGSAPASSAAAAGGSVNNKMTLLFDRHVATCTRQNWKYWVFSRIMQPLLESYDRTVSSSSLEDMARTSGSWLDQHVSLVQLRPLVLNSLKDLSVDTEILSEPHKMPQEALNAVSSIQERQMGGMDMNLISPKTEPRSRKSSMVSLVDTKDFYDS